ncbi:unnamed protein product [Arctia plantaginis]|uniref:Uncharacterized protein n=1 Tax=Arctia plantaginis TaxID=874455 RepID=A0A8S1A720_ARCPL|nr:unnamed protein product [Arctia plantaginis]
MCEFIALSLILFSVSFVITDCSSSFDQRQTGDFNVQIGLKNIQLIALLKGGKEEYVDYDYAYDYSEMTIKPQNGTTPKPLNVASPQVPSNGTTVASVLVQNATSTANIVQQPLNLSISQNVSNQLTNVTDPIIIDTEFTSNITLASDSEVINNNETLFNITTVKTGDSTPQTNEMANISSATSTHIPEIVAVEPTTAIQDSPNNISATQISHCRRGFVQNHQGKCEYKGHGTTNALRRIVKLAQKIKIGRGYKET